MMKLNRSPRPDDISARMPLKLFKRGDVLVDAEGQEGWIEFWAEDALAIKQRIKTIGGRLYRITALREKRTKRDWDEMSDTALANELDEMKALTAEALAIRVKAWRLLASDGEAIEAPVTMENARSLFADDDHELRDVVTEWLRDNPELFTGPKSAS
jgi:hypothetical protein